MIDMTGDRGRKPWDRPTRSFACGGLASLAPEHDHGGRMD
jgi:hypothetical protein